MAVLIFHYSIFFIPSLSVSFLFIEISPLQILNHLFRGNLSGKLYTRLHRGNPRRQGSCPHLPTLLMLADFNPGGLGLNPTNI